MIYGYATAVFSSRKLERATYDSVAFRFIAANQHPDHDTIAAFRRRFVRQIAPLFVQACAAAGIEPVIAMGREAHHPSLAERVAEPPPPPQDPTPLAAMAHRLETPQGKRLYGLRKQTAEPVFGIIKSVLGFRQFLRGDADDCAITAVVHRSGLDATGGAHERCRGIKMRVPSESPSEAAAPFGTFAVWNRTPPRCRESPIS